MKIGCYRFFLFLIFSLILMMGVSPAAIAAKAPDKDQYRQVPTVAFASRILDERISPGVMASDTPINTEARIYPPNGATNIPTTVTISWGPVNRATGYDFKLSTDRSFNNIISSQDGLTTNNYTVQNLKPLTIYFWEVRAFIFNNIGNWVVSSFITMGYTTTTNLISSANPSVLGSTITLSATVKDPNGTGTPTGIVTFKEGETVLGTERLDSGTASLSIAALPLGNHILTAAYSYGNTFAESTSDPLTQMINGYPTTTVLTSSMNPSVDCQSVTLTASVTENSGKRTSYGKVIFYMNGEVLDRVSLNSEKATLTTSALAPGSYTFSAFYPDTGDYAASRSSDLTQVVNQPASGIRVITILGIGILCVMAGLVLFLFTRKRFKKLPE
jgi:hypothetical protein